MKKVTSLFAAVLLLATPAFAGEPPSPEEPKSEPVKVKKTLIKSRGSAPSTVGSTKSSDTSPGGLGTRGTASEVKRGK